MNQSSPIAPHQCGIIHVAGGCFWGTEALMRAIPGVIDATSGYANSTVEHPTYEQVCLGTTGAREAVRVTYDLHAIGLETILYAFFRSIDPSAKDRQGNDRGTQYQAGIYYRDEAGRQAVCRVVETEKLRCARFNVEVGPLASFYPAEAYHQDYLRKNPGGYCHVSPKLFSQVAQITVDAAAYTRPSSAELAAALSPLQFQVTQNAGTEPTFENEFWDHFEAGLYVDIATGEPLFLSTDKYACTCGWPAFSAPIDPNVLVERVDRSHGMIRTEVVSRVGNSHVGHVFPGDPESPSGVRYCIDSAALRFVPADDMEAQGYGASKLS